MIRRALLAGTIALVAGAILPLAACPLPQPLASVGHEDGGTKTPPRVDVSSAIPRASLVKVSTSCPQPPAFTVGATLIDDDNSEPVTARWFVDYTPDSDGSRMLASEDLPGSEEPTQTTRALSPLTFSPADFGVAPGIAHVLEVVVSNGFYPPGTAGLPLPNRTPQPGFETQVFRWVFQFDPSSENCGP